MNENIVVLSTCPSAEDAERIARALVEERLAGCVQVLPPMRSIYRWEGNVETALEHLLLIKTSETRFDEIRARITELHSYDVPEILALPVAGGSEPYLGWLRDALRG